MYKRQILRRSFQLFVQPVFQRAAGYVYRAEHTQSRRERGNGQLRPAQVGRVAEHAPAGFGPVSYTHLDSGALMEMAIISAIMNIKGARTIMRINI